MMFGMNKSFHLFFDKYFTEGKKFRLGSNSYWNILKESITKPYESLYHDHCKKLAFENAIVCGHLSIDFYQNVPEYSPNSFLIKVSGDSKVCLSNPSSEKIDINFSFRHLFEFRQPKSVFIRKENGEKISLLSNLAYSVPLLPNEKIEFICQGINIDKSRGIWVFDNVGII